MRPGQPRILDFAKAGMKDYGKFVMGRATRDTGAKALPSHAVWPNKTHRQKVPPEASVTGQHTVSGDGMPASLQVAIRAGAGLHAQTGSRHARRRGRSQPPHMAKAAHRQAYFLNAMSESDHAGATEMVIWSSSEAPEPGWGLMDYASNSNVDKWLKEKVLLPATETDYAIPAGIFAKTEGAMLHGIAYGQELNLARPTDKRIAWEPEWTAKLRVKSMTMVMLGEEGSATSGRPTPGPDRRVSTHGLRQQTTPGHPRSVRCWQGTERPVWRLSLRMDVKGTAAVRKCQAI